MTDFTAQWIDHIKKEIDGRMRVVASVVTPAEYDELVTDLAWFTFRFAKNPDTKMRQVPRG